MTTVAHRLKELRASLDLTQAELAKRAHLKNQSIIGALESGARKKSSHIPAIAKALGVEAFWLAEGKGPKHGGSVVHHEIQNMPTPASELSVPLLANSGSMGGGSESLEGDLVIGALTVQRSWVAKELPNISSAANLRFIHSYGDSMKPTFSDGDVLLVDAGIKEPAVDGIYVLAVRDQLFIKRVSRRFDGQHEISSDNPSVKTVEVLNGDHQIEIKGRVVWAWKGERL